MFEEGNALRKVYGVDKVFDFSLGNPDIEPPPAFHRVFLRLAQEDHDGKTPGCHGYMSNAGFSETREAVAGKVSREHHVKIDGSHVVMSVGAAGALNCIFKAILNPGDEVVVTRPYFMQYGGYVENHQGRLVEVDALPDFGLDVDAIGRALSEKTAAVLINSPHNPTGRVYPASVIAELARLMKAHGEKCGRMPYLVADEPYREIVYDGIEVPPVLSAYDESIVVSSFSKNLSLPGERIGYAAVGPRVTDADELVGAIIYATPVLGYVNAPALMQRIVAELMDEKANVEIYAKRRAAFTAILDEAGIEYAKPEGAFYLFAKVPPRKHSEGPEDDQTFVDHLKKYLVLGVPGSGFAKSGWLRLAYCVDEALIRASGEAFRKAMSDW
jgi:aspartate aminotransferase